MLLKLWFNLKHCLFLNRIILSLAYFVKERFYVIARYHALRTDV